MKERHKQNCSFRSVETILPFYWEYLIVKYKLTENSEVNQFSMLAAMEENVSRKPSKSPKWFTFFKKFIMIQWVCSAIKPMSWNFDYSLSLLSVCCRKSSPENDGNPVMLSLFIFTTQPAQWSALLSQRYDDKDDFITISANHIQK